MENKHLAKAIIYGTILLIISNVTGYGILGSIFAVMVTIASIWLAMNTLNSQAEFDTLKKEVLSKLE